MFVSPAYAQAAGGAGPSLLAQLPFFIAIFAIFYFLLIRPQQKKAKEHRNMVDALRRGDQVLTQGGIYGKVTKVKEGEDDIEVEIAKDVRIRVLRSAIGQVVSKTEPADG